MWLAFNMPKAMEDFHYQHQSGLLADDIYLEGVVGDVLFLPWLPRNAHILVTQEASVCPSFVAWADAAVPDVPLTPTYEAVHSVFTAPERESAGE